MPGVADANPDEAKKQFSLQDTFALINRKLSITLEELPHLVSSQQPPEQLNNLVQLAQDKLSKIISVGCVQDAGSI